METTRATLTLITPQDFPEVLEMFYEKDTFKYIAPLQNKTQQEYIEFLNLKLIQIEKREGYYWVARLKSNGEYIGSMNLTPHKGSGRIQLGFQLKQSFWNQGFATELAARILQFGIEDWQLNTIYGYYNEENIASEKILRKLGFVPFEDLIVAGESSLLKVVKFRKI